MEDRFLFKAKTAKIVDTYNNGVEDGVWVHGSLRCDVGKYTIFQFEIERADYVEYEIDPTTICQCTGMKDKNGKLIWENDILNLDEGINAECFWDEVNMEWGLRNPTRTVSLCSYSLAELAVIGNIFDNPELLKSERIE